MDDAVDLVNRFIEAEHRAVVATHAEPDDEAVARATAEAEAFLHSEPGSIVGLGFGRPPGMSSADLEPLAATADQLVPRPLFAVASFDHGGRTVYRAFVGSQRDAEGYEYDLSLNIAPAEGALRIVGKTAVDPFGPEDELRWEAAGGEQFPDDLPVADVRPFRRPLNPVHAAHYDGLAVKGTT